MTPEQHETLRLKARVIALETVLNWVSDIQRKHYGGLPEPSRSQAWKAFENKISAGREEYSSLTISGLHPVESDLHAALFQEAFDEISKKLLATVCSGLTPEEVSFFKSLR